MSASTIVLAAILIGFALLGWNHHSGSERRQREHNDDLFDIADFISSFFDRK